MLKTWADFHLEIPAGASGEIDTTCPQCSNQRRKKQVRCLSINVDKGIWNCAHCGWSGGLLEGARHDAPGWNKPAYRRPAPLIENRDVSIVEWFARRGISRRILERNRVSEASVYMPQVEERVGAIAFPYYRGDELINIKYRDREKNFRMETGAERILYGLNDLDAACTIIVEGEIDKLSLDMAGYPACVSVPDGAPAEHTKNYAGKFTFLDADAERLESVRQWILAVDNDAPGKRLEDELARRLGREKCWRVTWPEGCKDANDVLMKCGAAVLSQCILAAVPLPIEGVFTALDLSAKIQQLYENGWEKGILTGWAELDRFYTVRAGEFTVVTGMPNSGKSNWLDALIVNLAAEYGWQFAIFSPENQPIEDHMSRMVEKFAGLPFADGPSPRMARETLQKGIAWCTEHMAWILPDDDSQWTIDTVLNRAKALVLRRGIRGLIIDPWNELEHEIPNGITETIYIGQVLRKVRQFARRHGVHVWIVAHPQKMYRTEGQYPVPTLYDISGSANWRNKADNGIVIWRDFQNDSTPVEVHVQKVRFRQIGRIGMAKLAYQKATQTYRDLSFEDGRNESGSASRRRTKE